jgi:ATP-dependent helicase HrpA
VGAARAHPALSQGLCAAPAEVPRRWRERDQRHAPTLAAFWNNYEARLKADRDAGRHDPKLEEFRWLIEELRVSLFAQELRTPLPVSAKRLQKFWDEHLR